MKRFFDLTISLPGLILLLPIFTFVVILIKADSSGPVFFRQQRVGRSGKPFLIYKFRTMHVGSEGGSSLTVAGDARITQVGHFLRKYKLDELPQLINVLKGEMSLVGPRPEVPEYVSYYPDASRELILSVRPGITDTASLEYFDENKMLAQAENPQKVYLEEILPRKIAIYEDYARNHSLSGDVVIILKTVFRIIPALKNV